MMLVTKNNLLRKSVELSEYKDTRVGEFVKDLTGSNILLLTDTNPFSLILLLEKSKVRVPAKAGDTATGEILIPAGNTGLPPGPVISEFGEVKVPTRIEGGSIWVSKDTVVARKGDPINAKMASVLSKLGLKPMEAGLTLVAAYDNGAILSAGDLSLDLTRYRKDLSQALSNAFSLSIEAAFVTREAAPRILGRVLRQALALAAQAGYLEPGTVEHVLQRAVMHATILNQKVQTARPAGNP
jgi:large subunit ribosomal protein L10